MRPRNATHRRNVPQSEQAKICHAATRFRIARGRARAAAAPPPGLLHFLLQPALSLAATLWVCYVFCHAILMRQFSTHLFFRFSACSRCLCLKEEKKRRQVRGRKSSGCFWILHRCIFFLGISVSCMNYSFMKRLPFVSSNFRASGIINFKRWLSKYFCGRRCNELMIIVIMMRCVPTSMLPRLTNCFIFFVKYFQYLVLVIASELVSNNFDGTVSQLTCRPSA